MLASHLKDYKTKVVTYQFIQGQERKTRGLLNNHSSSRIMKRGMIKNEEKVIQLGGSKMSFFFFTFNKFKHLKIKDQGNYSLKMICGIKGQQSVTQHALFKETQLSLLVQDM